MPYVRNVTLHALRYMRYVTLRFRVLFNTRAFLNISVIFASYRGFSCAAKLSRHWPFSRRPDTVLVNLREKLRDQESSPSLARTIIEVRFKKYL